MIKIGPIIGREKKRKYGITGISKRTVKKKKEEETQWGTEWKKGAGAVHYSGYGVVNGCI